MRRVANLAPGVLTCLIVAAICTVTTKSSVIPAALASPMLLAIVIGAIAASFLGFNRLAAPGIRSRLTATTEPGTQWAAKHLLRAGVVLLGLRLSLTEVVGLGWRGILIVVGTLAITFAATLALGRTLRVHRTTSLLIATGFSVCGAAAVSTMVSIFSSDAGKRSADRTTKATSAVGTATSTQITTTQTVVVLDGDDLGDVGDCMGIDDEVRDTAVATSIALVTFLGLGTVLLGPWITDLLGMDDRQAGLWIGASFPEVAHVAAAAGTISVAALAIATVAKLARVVLLAPLVAAVSVVVQKRNASAGPEGHTMARYGQAGSKAPAVPLFVLGFLGCVVARSLGIVPDGIVDAANVSATFLLVAAMFGMGLGVNIPHMTRTAKRPLLLGLGAAVIAMVSAGVLVTLLG